MRERPIIFSGQMVQAILDGKKTQIRRVIKIHPSSKILRTVTYGNNYIESVTLGGNIGQTFQEYQEYFKCPYGQVGDRLWVRESIRLEPEDIYYKTDGMSIDLNKLTSEQNEWLQNYDGIRHNITIPSIHMPRWASRITLEITKIRVEKLQDISFNDALAEGVSPFKGPMAFAGVVITYFKQFWDSINAKRGYGWDENPWVWVIEFKKLNKEKK